MGGHGLARARRRARTAGRSRTGAHETVLTRPRDVRRAGDPVDLRWVKRRWKCADEDCERKTFTEWLPQVPPRCRITARLREQAAPRGRGAGDHPGGGGPACRDVLAVGP